MEPFSFFDESDKQAIATDEKSIIIYANRKAFGMLDYNKEEILGSPLASFILNKRDFLHMAEGDHVLTFLNRSGNRQKYRVSAIKGMQESKTIWLFVLNEAVRPQPDESELVLLKTMIDTVSDIVYIKDANGVYLSCNRAFSENFIGIPKEEILGKTDFDFIKHGRIANVCTQKDNAVIKSRQPLSYEETLIFADKKEVIVDTLKVPYFDQNGNVKFIIGISRDITLRKKLEEDLLENNKATKLLYELYNKASKNESLDQFIDLIGNIIIELYPLDGILFYLFSESREKMLLFSCYGISKKFIVSASVLNEDDGMLNSLIEDDSSVEGKIKNCPESMLKNYSLKEGFQYYSSSPIVYRSKLLGSVVILQKTNRLKNRQNSFIPFACDALSVVVNNYMLNEKQNRDYEELLNLKNALLQAKMAAEAENRAQSKFLATMSHEIRTPLNGIIGFLDLLSRSRLNQEQTIYIDNAINASKTLLPLINDILDISKIKSSGFILEKIDFQLLGIVKEVIAFHSPMAKEKGFSIKLSTERGLPQYVSGDPARFEEILNNLVSNAIKFTSAGGIEVRIRLVTTDNSKVVLRFEVSDTGIGISKDKLRNLFKPYSQADNSISRQYGGTGLGLVICKELVKRMGGSIKVESAPNIGTTFSFTLKFGTVANAPAKETGNAKVMDMGLLNIPKDVRILLAEDNMINRQLVIFSLKNAGLRCDVACNGAEALKLAVAKKYDIVFMDCQMPKMDGYEATAKIREIESKKKHTAIIAMTANSMAGDRRKCLDSGMDDYISKPIDFATMYELIKKYCPEKNKGKN